MATLHNVETTLFKKGVINVLFSGRVITYCSYATVYFFRRSIILECGTESLYNQYFMKHGTVTAITLYTYQHVIKRQPRVYTQLIPKLLQIENYRCTGN